MFWFLIGVLVAVVIGLVAIAAIWIVLHVLGLIISGIIWMFHHD